MGEYAVIFARFLSAKRMMLAVFAIAGVFLTLALANASEPLVPASLWCVTVAGTGKPYNILVVGESWVSYGRQLPDMPMAVSARLGGRTVHACGLGFSGDNAEKINTTLRATYPLDDIRALFDGQDPDKVVILAGVNDIIQHVGADNYEANVVQIANYFGGGARVEVMAIPRVNERHFNAIFSRSVKRALKIIWVDGGQVEVNDKYRRALASAAPRLRIINYDRFLGPYEQNANHFLSDGVHLNPDAFKAYAHFIGTQVDLNSGA